MSSSAIAQLSQDDLSEMVRNAIRNETVSFDAPRFDYDYDRGELRVFIGGRKRHGRGDVTPLDHATDLQFQVELIRKHRANFADFWRPYLTNIESIVSRELEIIAQNDGDRGRLRDPLAQLDRNAKDVLQEALAESARNTGLRLRRLSGAGGVHRVVLKSAPPGAVVYYLAEFDFNVANKAGLGNKIASWSQVTDSTVILPNGSYYFYAVWRENASRRTGLVQINRDMTINLDLQ